MQDENTAGGPPAQAAARDTEQAATRDTEQAATRDTEQAATRDTEQAATQVPATRAALGGVAAAAMALAAGELAAAPAAPLPGPVYGVANRVIDIAPSWFVDLGKNLFGLADKPALVLGTTILALAIGAGLGLASRRGPAPGIAGITGFGVLGLLAISADPQGSLLGGIVVAVIAVAVGCAALATLHSRAASTGPGQPRYATATSRPLDSPVDPAVTRRRFLGALGTVGAAAALAGAGANALRSRSTASQARDAVQLTPGASGAGVSAAVQAAETTAVATTPGISPLVVPNGEFYRIDTALLTPQVDPARWSLRITGMVDEELTFSYDDLIERATMVAPVTLSCVSNEVGGDLVGNAIWQGVPLVELLDEAGLQPGATQIASRSVDGWTCGFPTEAAYDGRTAMVAVAMNDEPLPLDHGFPARLVVAGLYGYVSATKWLSSIEATTMEGFDGYWIPRGWSKLGPVKTQSRIDTPRSRASPAAGTVVPIAGVAWAPDAGIERVEVRIDDGPWQEAELGDSLGPDAWRQWLLAWTATPGRHVVQVRATDATGYTQTELTAPPAPNGATGWHQIVLDVA